MHQQLNQRLKSYGADQPQPSARESMLSMRLESGDAWAFPYSCLTSICYEKAPAKLVLTFSTHRVIINGERLHLLYGDLLGHAVQFIQVTAGQDIGNDACNIISLAVEELQSEAPPEDL